MGLLERAQSKKGKTENETEQIKNIEREQSGLLQKAIQKKEEIAETETNKEEETTKESGLLEKAQSIKEKPEKNETEIESELKSSGLLQKAIQKKEEDTTKKSGLLEKAQQSREKFTTFEEEKQEQDRKKIIDSINDDSNIEIIEEKSGFGWNGLATRSIVFNNNLNEYIYVVNEPVLNDFEQKKKNELSRLFKMLADVNITNINQEEKEKYLGEILEQIIIDNNIKFKEKKIEESKEKGSLLKFVKKEKQTNEIKNKTPLKEKILSKSKRRKNKSNSPILEIKEELSEAEKESKEKIFYHIFRDFLGYGKIDIIMKDDGIEDISCDGHHVPVFIYHKKYNEVTTNVMFDNENELNSFVVRLAQICGKQISIYSPIVDGKLPDGSRLQTTLARTVTKGSTFTIRKFKENPLTPVDMIGFQSLSLDMAAYFWLAIERGASILFCGGTASGKTTALNALSLFIPPQHKIITIEDTREVNLPHKNWIAGTTRQGFSSSETNKTGKDIDMFDLIRAALRQRPKVVIVGEVRGKEAYSLFQAMATGHTSYATVHASDIHTLVQRLENPPISLPRALLTSLDIIVFQNAIDIAGKTVRRMTSVTEIVKLDPDTNQLIFMEPFRWISKTDDRFDKREGSKIMNNIRLQSDWSEKQLEEELENRKLILKWMRNKDMRSYLEVGRVVSDYCKYPDRLLKKVRGEMKL